VIDAFIVAFACCFEGIWSVFAEISGFVKRKKAQKTALWNMDLPETLP
jgi:hypothetical protein